MKNLYTCLFCAASLTFLAQPPNSQSVPQTARIMVAAVARNGSMLTGGIGLGQETESGKINVEPLAWVSPSGDWTSTGCDGTHQRGCPRFEREYLKHPHKYTVVSANGEGAIISAAPVKLDECNDYTTKGTYSGVSIARSAIAAGSAELFADSKAPQLLVGPAAIPVHKALGRLVPRTLDSVQRLKVFSLQLEGRKLLTVQRSYSDRADLPEDQQFAYVFAIGTIDQGNFHILHWKKNTEDEEERILGTIRLKSGREFLITSVTDPESQSFRIYGIRDGKLALIYSGGGASC